MKIERIIHNTERRRELFGLIGEFCASRETTNELGAQVTSEPGDVWFIALVAGEVAGFAAIHPQKNGRARMMHLYVVPGVTIQGVDRRLVQACETEAKSMGVRELVTVDYGKRQRFYEFNGWRPDGQRGRFLTYEKRLSDG